MDTNMGLPEAIDKIDRHFYSIDNRLGRDGSNHLLNYHTYMERIYCGLLNLIFGFSVQNLNTEQLNAPGIDLVDNERYISIQLSSDASATKIRKTLNTFFRHKLHHKYDTLYIVFMGSSFPTVTDYSANLKDDFVFNVEDHVWNHDKLFKKIKDELDTATVKAIAKHLDEELGNLSNLCTRPTETLPPIPAHSKFFISDSRKEEIETLVDCLRHDNSVSLCGCGGIGKTQTAIALVEEFKPEWGASYIKYIQSSREGEENMQASILHAKFGGKSYTNPDPKERENEFKRRIGLLREYGKRAVLILDDFWLPGFDLEDLCGEESYDALQNCGINLIFTTRFRHGNAHPNCSQERTCHILALSADLLMQKIRTHCDNEMLTDDRLRPLLNYIDCNPLAAQLIAKSLEYDAITPEALLDAFKHGPREGITLPSIENDRDRESNGKPPHLDIFGHLARLYDITALNETSRQVLALLLACPDKCCSAVFHASLTPSQQQFLRKLHGARWINRRNGIITVESIVRLAHQHTLKPDSGELLAFLGRMRRKWDDPYLEHDHRNQLPDIFRSAAQLLDCNEQVSQWLGELNCTHQERRTVIP